jgi:pyridoxine/pyridoxamine 5'-phosphate oxidase
MTEPDEYKQLNDQLWSELEQAVMDRQHGWRTPVLATVDADGLPDARTVVLRAADRARQTLKVFTDQRSPKVVQLQANPQAQLVFWCPSRQWQLRARAAVTIDINSDQTAAIWTRIQQTAAAGDYLTAEAPGSLLSDQASLSVDQHALCVLELKIMSLDWLMLSRQGHRRARLEHDTLTWLTP